MFETFALSPHDNKTFIPGFSFFSRITFLKFLLRLIQANKPAAHAQTITTS